MPAGNGIAESYYASIGGIDQWITIRGENRANPILLFVHGGPGSTYTIFNPLLRSWEQNYTIVQWDQRGTGKTLSRNGEAGCGTLTFDRLAEDGIELARHIARKLGHDKVVLVGSSAGSLTGLLMAKRRPDLFHAYVGTDQNAPDPEHLAHRIALDAMRAARMAKGVSLLERIGPDRSRLTIDDFNALTRTLVKIPQPVPSMITDLILPAMLASPDHSFRDMGDMFKGMKFSLEQLFKELTAFDFGKVGTTFELPFFIVQGDSDLITPTATAETFFRAIRAPHKQFALIRGAGHLACFSRPEQFLAELNERVRPLVVTP
jgi:pimeloyl-ACP methyl ester carboxylesterase